MNIEEKLIQRFEKDPKEFVHVQQEINKVVLDFHYTLRETPDKPFPVSPIPLFFKSSWVKLCFNNIKTVVNCLLKIRKEYYSNSELRSYIGLSKEDEEILATDAGALDSFGSLRIDAFLQADGNIKLVEVNSDFPDGINTISEIFDFYQRLPHIKELDSIQPQKDISELLLNSMFSSYESSGKVKKPVFGIFAPPDRWWLGEFANCRNYLKENGYEAHILDPQRLEYKNGRLVHEGKNIDMIRKATEIFYFKKHHETLKPFLESYKRGDFVLYNRFKDRLLGYKTLFAVLTDDKWSHLFDKDELEVIRRLVPWTRRITGDITLDYLINNKDKLVIKPSGETDAYGVFAGIDFTKEEWKKKSEWVLSEAIKGSEWIVQEKIHISKRPVLRIEDGQLKKEEVNFDLMFHLLGVKNGMLEGPVHSRSSKSFVVNMSHGGAVHPVFETD